MPDDKLKTQMFQAACIFVMMVLLYCFICIFVKPIVDLTAPLIGIATFLLGYYYGTSQSNKDKDAAINKQMIQATDAAKLASITPGARDAIITKQMDMVIAADVANGKG